MIDLVFASKLTPYRHVPPCPQWGHHTTLFIIRLSWWLWTRGWISYPPENHTLKEYGNTVMPTLKWIKICLTTLLGLFSVDVNTSWSNWKSSFLEIMSLCVPSKTILLLALQKLLVEMKKRNALYQKVTSFQSGNCTRHKGRKSPASQRQRKSPINPVWTQAILRNFV